MATLNQQYQTLIDLSKQMNGNTEIERIIELLSENNTIVQDAPAQQCNQGVIHLTTVRTGLPSVTWRKLYQGVQPSKSTSMQVKDTVGMLEAWSEVDSKLVDIAPNPAQFRLNEAQAFLEAMSIEMATGVFYHDTATDPEKFMGLAPRFNDLSAQNGRQIIDAGGVGTDNTSVWFIVWGEKTTSLLFPRGSTAGLTRKDKGEETKELNDGSLYEVFREKFTWDIGLTVRDWRYVARVANIDVSELEAGSVDIDDLMIDAYYKLQQRFMTGGKAMIYCNTTVKTALHKIAKGKDNVNLTLDSFEGKEIMNFLGMPIRENEAIVNNEERVV